jgi:hypothetical protein
MNSLEIPDIRWGSDHTIVGLDHWLDLILRCPHLKDDIRVDFGTSLEDFLPMHRSGAVWADDVINLKDKVFEQLIVRCPTFGCHKLNNIGVVGPTKRREERRDEERRGERERKRGLTSHTPPHHHQGESVCLS